MEMKKLVGAVLVVLLIWSLCMAIPAERFFIQEQRRICVYAPQSCDPSGKYHFIIFCLHFLIKCSLDEPLCDGLIHRFQFFLQHTLQIPQQACFFPDADS